MRLLKNVRLFTRLYGNYQCMVRLLQLFSGETCMYSVLTWYPVRSMDGLCTCQAAG